ncbi:MAG: ribosome assembly RNA-binding protein YhbY [Candidatus Competibacteraceae bacterium]|nr:ribosome assembly RNA-binding protein YhbY [Candidatus Competibacteraceae bacterium]
MLTLTLSQKRHLKALAHHRKPVVIVGNNGVTPGVSQEIDQALSHHELIKVRVNAEDRDARERMIEALCAESDATLVQRIGHVAILFRRNPDAPRVEWPV